MADRKKRSGQSGQSSRRSEKPYTPADTRSGSRYYSSQGMSSEPAQKSLTGYPGYESTGSHDHHPAWQASITQDGIGNASFPLLDDYGDQSGDLYDHGSGGGTVAPDYLSQGLGPATAGHYQAGTDDQGHDGAWFEDQNQTYSPQADDEMSMGVQQGLAYTSSPTTSFDEQTAPDNALYTSQVGRDNRVSRQKKKKGEVKNAKTDRGRSNKSVEKWMCEEDPGFSGQTSEHAYRLFPGTHATQPPYKRFVEERDLEDNPSMADAQIMYPDSQYQGGFLAA